LILAQLASLAMFKNSFVAIGAGALLCSCGETLPLPPQALMLAIMAMRQKLEINADMS
jgi:hypothetical protein